MMKPIRILVIAGPTAVGKTAFAIEAAKQFAGEIVSCDSMQIYRYMDIGSAKPTKEELAAARHHLVDVIDPRDEFSVAGYQRMAIQAIRDIDSHGMLPIVCGGTGLYLNSLLYEMDFGEGPKDPALRAELEETARREGSAALHDMLLRKDPKAAGRIHPNNTKKLIRALERLELGETAVHEFSSIRTPNAALDPLLIGLTRDRQELYERIDRRVDQLIGAGLADEVRSLQEMGLSEENMSMLGIGYREMFEFLRGGCTLEEAADRIRKNTRHYAKRQLTWFRRYDTMEWLNISDYPSEEAALEELIRWLKEKL